MIEGKQPGQVAYDAYREVVPVSEHMPSWSDMDEEVKSYWAHIERSVIDCFCENEAEHMRQLFDGRG